MIKNFKGGASTTRAPTNDEIDNCTNIIMSNEQHWDPNEATFLRNISSVEGGKRYSAGFLSLIMVIKTNTCGNKFNSDNTNILDQNQGMSQMSTGLTLDLLVQGLHNSVNDISATYCQKRHHGTDLHLLACKWGIRITKAIQTLKCTTQQNIRSAILPLIHGYRTDLFSQQLRRLFTRFFTDTAFAKEKSTNGNGCVQIFTDGEGFVMAIPMKSKSEADEKIQVFCKDVGIPNELHMDNGPEMTKPNSLFQKVCKEKIIHFQLSNLTLHGRTSANIS